MTIVVLGGGLTGLAAAYYLSQAALPIRIVLLEASSRLGGWVHSTRHPDGVFHEHGPHTIRFMGEAGKNTLLLAEELGLEKRILSVKSNDPALINRMVFVHNKIYKLPAKFSDIFKSMPPLHKPLIFTLLQELILPKKQVDDESVFDFALRRLGQDVAEYIVDPFIRGICAGDARQVSVKFQIFKSLFEAEQIHGSIIKGLVRDMIRKEKPAVSLDNSLTRKAKEEKWSVWSLDGGLQTLPEALLKCVINKGVKVCTSHPCQSLTFKNENVMVKCGGEEFLAHHVLSAIPSFSLAPLVQRQHPELAALLSSIPFVTCAVINLEFLGSVLQEKGFGVLVPSSESVPVLGIISDSCIFPQSNRTILTVMMGGAWFDSLFGPSPAEQHLLETALKSVKMILGITSKPMRHEVSVLRHCIPQYIIGHEANVVRMRQYIKQQNLCLSLAGVSYDGVGVNDAILSGKQASDSVKKIAPWENSGDGII